MRIIAIVQARMGSTRLPNKVMQPIGENMPMIGALLLRLSRSKEIDKIILATSNDPRNQPLVEYVDKLGFDVFKGSENDILDRYYQVATKYGADVVVRITGDCPLVDWQAIDQTIQYHVKGKYDYVNNRSKPAFPDGLDVEVITYSTLKNAFNNAILPSEKEHVTYYVRQRKDKFKLGYFYSTKDLSHMRWTVDESEDFILVEKIYKNLYKNNPKFSMKDVLELLNNKPELLKINSHIGASEGMKKSLKEDEEFIKNEL